MLSSRLLAALLGAYALATLLAAPRQVHAADAHLPVATATHGAGRHASAMRRSHWSESLRQDWPQQLRSCDVPCFEMRSCR